MSKLVEIPCEHLPALKEKFAVDWPKHIVAFGLIDNFIKRFSERPESRGTAKFYSLDGDWENDGTFIWSSVSGG